MATSRALLAAALLPLVAPACSPAENKCGDLCCCVTCTCLEGPYRCEDMWGKPTDAVGYTHDERWSDPAWLENHHREQMEIAEQHRQEHMERMKEMQKNMPKGSRKRRRKMMMEDMMHDADGEGMPGMAGLPGHDGEDGEGGGDTLAEKMRNRMEKRMKDAMKRKWRRGAEEEDEDEDEDEEAHEHPELR